MVREHRFRPGRRDGGTLPFLRLGFGAGLVLLAAAIYAGANNGIARIDRAGAPEAPFTESELEALRGELSEEQFAALQQAIEYQNLRQNPSVRTADDGMRQFYVWSRNIGVPVCLALALVTLAGAVFRMSVSGGGNGSALQTSFTFSSSKGDSLEAISPEIQSHVQDLFARGVREGEGVYTSSVERYTVTDETGETRVYHSIEEVPPEIRDRMRKFM